MKPPAVLYLTPGCFDKGGISRYSRFQISALRHLFGAARVSVFSVLGPGVDSFEEPFETTYWSGGVKAADKARFIARAASHAMATRPALVWAAHVNLSGLAKVLARAVGGRTTLNVYGCEIWSEMRRDASWGLASADHVVSDCEFTAGYLRERSIRSADSMTVIWDCVDLRRFAPGPASPGVLTKYGIPDPGTGKNILTLGRLSRDAAYKGYERLMEAFCGLARELPAVRLIFAGRGDLVPTLKGMAIERGVEDRVFFTGMVDDADMADVYRSAHVFSLITDRGEGRGEGIPLTPLEAAACGVPILVGNQDGSQEAVIDGQNGFILDPFDQAAQRVAIAKLMGDESLRSSLAAAAAQRARDEFSYDGFLEKHRRLLASDALRILR